MSFFRYRIADKSLSTFDSEPKLKKQIKKFQKFVNQRADGYCCICLRLLYPEEQKYRYIEVITNLSCLKWKLPLLSHPKDKKKFMVCKKHYKTAQVEFPAYEYPGS